MVFELSVILSGIGAGITFGVTSYWKKKDQEFKWGKLGVTASIGAVAGLVASLFDMPIGMGFDYVVALGLVPIMENAIKIVTRKIFALDWF